MQVRVVNSYDAASECVPVSIVNSVDFPTLRILNRKGIKGLKIHASAKESQKHKNSHSVSSHSSQLNIVVSSMSIM